MISLYQPNIACVPMYAQTHVSRSIATAYYKLDNPIGDPFGGPAYGYRHDFWSNVFGGAKTIIQSFTASVSSVVNSIGDAFAKLDKEVFQPVGAALKPIGKMIEADPAAFLAQIAAVALAPATGGQSLWAIPIIQGTAAKSHGASWEDTVKVTAISAATVYAGNTLAPQLSSGLQAAGMPAGVAGAVAAVTVASSTAAIGAAVTGKNSDQILNAALTAGVAKAVPMALGAVPGFEALAKGEIKGLDATISKGIAYAIQGSISGSIGAAINNKDVSEGAMMGLMSAGIQTAINGATRITETATELFKDTEVAKQMSGLPSPTQTLLANAVVQTLTAAATGGRVGSAFNNAMLGAASAAIGQTLSQNGGAINMLTQAVSGNWDKLNLTLEQYKTQNEEYDGIAEERNALADQAEEERTRQEAILEQRENYVDEYEGLHDGIEDLKSTVNGKYDLVNSKATELNKFSTDAKTNSDSQQKYIDLANSQQATMKSLADSATYWANTANAEAAHMAIPGIHNQDNINYHMANYNSYVANYNNYRAQYENANAVYTTYVDTANSFGAKAQQSKDAYSNGLSEYNKLISDYEETTKQLTGLVAQADTKVTLIDSLTTEVNKISEDYKTNFVNPIADLDKQLESVTKQMEATIAEYQKGSDAIQKDAQPLSDLASQFTAAINKNIASAIDPRFNESEYKQINGLTASENAWEHYVTKGKDLGLYTNLAASDAARSQETTRLMEGVAEMTGRPLTSYSPDEITDLQDKIYSKYGNNLNALKNATAETMIKESGLDASDWLDPGGKKYTPASDWFYKKFANTPDGTRQATQEEILKNKATLQYVDGQPVWLVSDGSQAATQVKDGEILKNVVLETYQYIDENGVGRTIDRPVSVGDYVDRETGEVVPGVEVRADGTTNVIVRDPNRYYSVEEVKNTGQVQALQLDDLGGMETLYTYGGMDKDAAALVVDLGGVAKSETINAARAVLESAQATGNDTLINTAANVIKAGGGFITSIGGIATMFGVAPKDSDLGKQLESLGKAGNTQEYQAKINAINTMVGNAKGVGGTLNAIWEGFKSAPVQFVAEYIGVEGFQEIAPLLVGGAAGGYAKGLALAKGLGEAAATRIGASVGLRASMVSDLAESIGGQATSAYETTYKLAIQKGMTEAAASNYALDVAKQSGLMSGVLTAGTFGIGGLALEKALMPSGSANGMLASAIENLWNFAKTGGSITIKEGLSEAGEEGLNQFFLETKLYALDPTRDVAASVTSAAAFGALAGGPIAGGTYAASNGADILNAAYTLGNANFTKQLQSGNYTMGELGVIMNKWIPPEAVGLRSALVPPIISSNPQYAAGYANAGDFITALQSATGVSSPSVLANVAETVGGGKFASQVTTAQEAVDVLRNQGLTNITTADALSAGIVGATTADQATKAANYANQNMVSEAELRAGATQEGYNPTQAELDRLVGRGVQADVIAQFVKEIDPKAVTTAEAAQFFRDYGYDKATAADIAQFVKQSPETEVTNAVAAWVDPRQVTRNEAINYFANFNYIPTDAEINKYVVQGPEVFQDAVKQQIGAYTDPLTVDAEEVKAAFKSLGLNAPVTQSDLLRLSGQYAESELAAKAKEALPVVSANAAYAVMSGDANAIQNVKDALLAKIDEYNGLNTTQAEAQAAATEAIAAQLGIDKKSLLDSLGATEGNLLTKITDVQSALEAAIKDATDAGLKGDEALQKALDTVASDLGTTKEALAAQIGTQAVADDPNTVEDESKPATGIYAQLGGVQTQIADTKTALEKAIQDATDAGLKGDEALQKAIDTVAGNLGTTKTDLLAQLGTTETALRTEFTTQLGGVQTQLQSDIADTKKAILDQMQAYQDANIDANTALSLAISGVAQDLGTTKTDLLTQMGLSETALRNEFTKQTTELSTQVQDVAALLGKPASQVTTADMQMVQNMVSGQAATNLAYDTNQDGKIDQTDLTNIQNQIAFNQNQNIQQQTDPNTGLTVYVDTTTGKEVANPSVTGTQWASTGIYSILDQQKAQQAAAAKAQAATAAKNAATAQKQGNFNTLLSMIMQSPDAAGGTATTKQVDPAKINYLYDFGSIFATPQQQGLFPSPYGAINAFGTQQPATQGQRKMAIGGFAEGGMIGSDISVGDGGSVDDLLNILKGNSG